MNGGEYRMSANDCLRPLIPDCPLMTVHDCPLIPWERAINVSTTFIVGWGVTIKKGPVGSNYVNPVLIFSINHICQVVKSVTHFNTNKISKPLY